MVDVFTSPGARVWAYGRMRLGAIRRGLQLSCTLQPSDVRDYSEEIGCHGELNVESLTLGRKANAWDLPSSPRDPAEGSWRVSLQG